ncbi:MAG TPA: hypothetical protein VKG44_04710, partial [Candidatus Baltobacteraceae bacterium]|nr:hypothetical protein [Candidatus Baltobacteraceae bacterium]
MTPLFTIAILALGLARDPVQIAQAIPTAQPEVGAPATVPPNVVLPAVPAVEPRFRMPVNEKPLPPGGISGIVQEPFVGIALTDAIAMALAKNTDLQVAQQNRLIAAFQIQQAKGPYDVRLQIVPAYSSVASPTLNIFQAGPDLADYTIVDFGSSAQVAARTYGNTQISVNTSASRTNNNITADTYNPYYNTNITLNVTQPLLRGSASDPYR